MTIGRGKGGVTLTVAAVVVAVLTASPAADASASSYRLDDLRPVTTTAGVTVGPVAVGGATVRHAVAFGADDRSAVSATWRLRRRCSALDTGAAWPAPAPNVVSARVTVRADGRAVAIASVSEPRPARIHAVLGRAATLQVTVRFPATSGFGRRLVALLAPRLTCAADPAGP